MVKMKYGKKVNTIDLWMSDRWITVDKYDTGYCLLRDLLPRLHAIHGIAVTKYQESVAGDRCNTL